ncbi:MAG: potassium transporter TrkG, partial [Parabacteroides sp.]|nr:potassium transporter TrkG [Parabacteroides sp.]
MTKFHIKLLLKIRRILLKTSLEQWLCFGLKFNMPQKQIVVVYAGYSFLGTLLLALPFASNGDISFVDHLFTVVSAFSTTGLSTVDVATQYTLFGQSVILGLIQMGGLGYMTLSSYIMLRMTGKFGTQKAKLFQTQFAFPDTL